MRKYSNDEIKQFLIDKKYGGRRLSPLMDEQELDFVSGIISKIIKHSPKEINPSQYSSYDEKPHQYVDQAYWRPIEDFLIEHGLYMEVYDIPCPYCKKPFVTDKVEFTAVDLPNHKNCINCQRTFDVYETSPGLFGIPTGYLDYLENVTKLVKVEYPGKVTLEELEAWRAETKKKYPGF